MILISDPMSLIFRIEKNPDTNKKTKEVLCRHFYIFFLKTNEVLCRKCMSRGLKSNDTIFKHMYIHIQQSKY